MKQFKKDCEKQKKFFLDVLKKNREKYGKISAYGATSKSTTILNFCNVGTNYIDCIYDTTIKLISFLLANIYLSKIIMSLYLKIIR